MKATFQTEQVATLLDEGAPLVEAHYNEIAWKKDKIPLDIDYEMYQQMEFAGNLACYSLRIEEKLVGYSVYFIKHSPHYKSTRYAASDVIYLEPRCRGKTGGHFVDLCEKRLKEDHQVDVIIYHIKDEFDWSPAIAKRGYEKLETIWHKWIGD